MGSGGRDNDKGSEETTATLPPAYQEKQPLPPDNFPDVEKQGPPVIVQQSQPKCKRGRKRCCCYTCTVLIVLIVCCTIISLGIVYMSKDMWNQPFVDMSFEGSSSRVMSQSLKAGQSAVIKCDVDMKSRYMPLVQWFHDSNELADDDTTGYKLFAVHNQIQDEAYKSRFEITKTEMSDHGHRVTYTMVIKDMQPEDSGRYACQTPKAHYHGSAFIDEYQGHGSSSSSDSSSDGDQDHHGKHHNKHHNDDHHKGGCKHRRNDYLYISVTK